jgi:hypothetical protein
MARNPRNTAKSNDKPQSPLTLLTTEPARKPFGWLRRSEYNPKVVSDDQIDSICLSFVEFGIVDPFVVADDGEILGGHTRHMAIEKLLAGKFMRKHQGKKVQVKWSLPEDGCVPVMVVRNISPERRRMLNIALTKTEGEFDHDKLAGLLASLHREMNVDINDLVLTGFTVPEITDYFDLLDNKGSFEGGDKPGPTKGAPKLNFDFSSPELRDAVKRAVSAKSKDAKTPGGDVLATMLGVSV